MNQQCISLPLTQQRWQFVLMICVFSTGAILALLGAGYGVIRENDLVAALLTGLLGLVFLGFGILGLIHCFLWVHFVPEGVAVTLGPWTVRRIPAEQLRLAAQVQSPGKSAPITRTVLSRRSLEELAALREKQLAQSFYMRSNIPCRKRQSGWQQKFAEEYLQNRNNLVIVGYLTPDLLWLEHMPEMDAVLDAMYGHLDIPRMDFPVSYGTSTVWTDPDPRHFCRGRCKPGNWDVIQLVCLSFCLSPLVLFVIPLSGLPVAALLLGLVSLTSLLVWLLARGEYDVVHLEDDGIRLTAGNRTLGSIPAPEIRLIIRAEISNGLFYRGFLAVSNLSPAEIAAREITRLERTRTGRRLLAAWRQLPGWEDRLIVRSCCRALSLEGYRARDALLMANVPQRAEMLQKLYPDVPWIHVDTVGQIQS